VERRRRRGGLEKISSVALLCRILISNVLYIRVRFVSDLLTFSNLCAACSASLCSPFKVCRGVCPCHNANALISMSICEVYFLIF